MSAPLPLHQLATRARQDTEAMRLLHFGDLVEWQANADWEAFVAMGGPWLRESIAPPKRRLSPPGAIDFHRLHCLALDRLPELMAFLLPIGCESASPGGYWCWFGAHPQRRTVVAVNLLTGMWSEPNTGRAGRDLVSLYGHMFGVSPGRAARMVAEWLGAEVRAFA